MDIPIKHFLAAALILASSPVIAQNVYPLGTDRFSLKWPNIQDSGITAKFCSNQDGCSLTGVLDPRQSKYALLLVESDGSSYCGDIYARVNLLDSKGIAIGWANGRSHLGKGGKVLLSFSRVFNTEWVAISDIQISCSNFN
jgi:hypothetical protein